MIVQSVLFTDSPQTALLITALKETGSKPPPPWFCAPNWPVHLLAGANGFLDFSEYVWLGVPRGLLSAGHSNTFSLHKNGCRSRNKVPYRFSWPHAWYAPVTGLQFNSKVTMPVVTARQMQCHPRGTTVISKDNQDWSSVEGSKALQRFRSITYHTSASSHRL